MTRPLLSRQMLLRIALLLMCMSLAPHAVYAHDEVAYVSVMSGAAFSGKFTNVDNVGGSFEPGTTATDLALENSVLYGVKAGIYPKSGILGLETEVFSANHDINSQTRTFNEPTFGPFLQTQEGKVRVTTWALNVLARVPINDKLTAHVAIGPAILFSKLSLANEQSQSASNIGLNTQLGLNYSVTDQLSVFGEWKFNHARIKYPSKGTTEGFDANYNPHAIVVGLSYYFDAPLPWRSPISLKKMLGIE